MFFSYLWKELSRRKRQAMVVSLGLALGIGLVVAESAMATGVRQAQGTVLHSLYGVGTDITVSQAPASGSGPGAGFGFGNRSGNQGVSRDRIFASPSQETFSATKATTIGGLSGVQEAAGALNLTAIHINGKLPSPPSTSRGTGSGASQSPSSGTPGRINVSSYSIAGVDVLQSSVGPLSAVQITNGRAFTSADSNANVAVVSRSYAKQKSLSLGDTIAIGGKDFTVVGLATPSAQGAGSDVYLPLAKAQAAAGETGNINTVYVKATSSSQIATAKSSIKTTLPGATVSTASDLAKQVSGSLSSASNLATHLGTWLSVAALILAIVLASLLTLSSVGRRVRELGTLKAIGWRTRRVVGQVMGESLVQGLIGGALGLLIGLGGAWLITRVAPSLTATVSAFSGTGGQGGGPGGGFSGPPGSGANDLSRTISVALHAPVSISLVALAIGLALLGGVIAGLVGGLRAARMSPADAMRQVA